MYVTFHEKGDTFERAHIDGKDLTDMYNEPIFYTKKVRGIEKAWRELALKFSDRMTMGEAMNIVNSFNLECHSYCTVD